MDMSSPYPHTLDVLTPHLPPHCSPTNNFLIHFSSAFHTCIPTPLALVATICGCLSILSWLFAQLPQIIKNHKLKSTSGLSIYFLAEWCLGDVTNLLGCLLTGQATWQIIIGAYYCFVDFMLVGQWIWFEGLGRGRIVHRVWLRARRKPDGGDDGEPQNMRQVLEGYTPDTAERQPLVAASSKDIPHAKDSMFSTPTYGSFRSSKEDLSPNSGRRITSVRDSPLPSPSPRTVLLLSMVVCLASTTVSATPTPSAYDLEPHTSLHASTISLPPLGTILSWTSTILYLISRLPQLLKNFRLRSTAGLSPLLFAAAFSGNLFYSSSLLLNPNLWHDYEPYGGGGWAGIEGNDRAEWMLKALPFWLGAAGVLVMDAGIGVQFWLWGEDKDGLNSERVLVAEDGGNGKKRWEEVHGWMRGWVPSGRLSLRRTLSSTSSEERALLNGVRGGI